MPTIYRDHGWRGPVPADVTSEARTSDTRIIQSPFDVIAVLLLLFPLYGLFYPLESYLAVGTKGGSPVGGLPFPVTPVTLLLITAAVMLFYRKIIETRPFNHDILLYMFVATAFLSFLWSPEPQFSFQRALRLIPSIGIGLVFAQYYSTRRMVQLMSLALLISGPVSILVPLFSPAYGLSNLGNGYESAWRGAHVHKNFAGFLYSYGVVIILFAWRWKVIPLWLALSSVTTALIMCLMAKSATGIISMVFSLILAVVFTLVRKAPREFRIPILLTLLMLVVFSALLISINLEFIVGLTGRDLTFTGRTQIWASVWAEIQRQPFLGHGYGFWNMTDNPVRDMLWKNIRDTAAHSHNSWLDICLQLGLAGFIPFLGMTLLAIWRVFKLLIVTERRDVIMFLSLLIYLLMRSFSEVQFTDPGIFQLFWLVWIAASLRQIDFATVAAAKKGLRRPAERPSGADPLPTAARAPLST
ncbi:O-antigen ligase family protein [Xanthobacter autotrophicus]|uniref:O-antigen ligase family protein n=1 Tax=Xanthobacter autotrophicus TaxID=280 RepID=UPI003727384C